MILHGDELRPAMLFGDMLSFGELPGRHRRCTNVSHLRAMSGDWKFMRGDSTLPDRTKSFNASMVSSAARMKRRVRGG